jgi:hypothetical protein
MARTAPLRSNGDDAQLGAIDPMDQGNREPV